ncbi:unnamed protein product [Dicrocoelium dendriticum]|nr:unnamed protein product [Dicrocoelium dendriticum]
MSPRLLHYPSSRAEPHPPCSPLSPPDLPPTVPARATILSDPPAPRESAAHPQASADSRPPPRKQPPKTVAAPPHLCNSYQSLAPANLHPPPCPPISTLAAQAHSKSTPTPPPQHPHAPHTPPHPQSLTL